jgi:hypothetical protein
MVRSTDMDKLINLLAGDFKFIDIKMMFVFIAVLFPFTIFGLGVVLALRLGWSGLIGNSIGFKDEI